MACQRKAVPTFTTRSIDVSAPTSYVGAPDIAAGKMTFTKHCDRCHDLPDPSKYTSSQLDAVLPTMIRRSRLTKEEANNVTAYLKEDCKK